MISCTHFDNKGLDDIFVLFQLTTDNAQLTKEKTELMNENKEVAKEKNRLAQKNAELVNERFYIQEELNVSRTKLAEVQIAQTELQQNYSSNLLQLKASNAEVQRLQNEIQQLENQPKNTEEIYVLQTQVRF